VPFRVKGKAPADIWRLVFREGPYGVRVFARKATVTRRSQNVIEINKKLMDFAGKAEHPIKKAREACKNDPRAVRTVVYRGGKKYTSWIRVPIKCLMREASKYMSEIVKPVVKEVVETPT